MTMHQIADFVYSFFLAQITYLNRDPTPKCFKTNTYPLSLTRAWGTVKSEPEGWPELLLKPRL